MTDPNLILPLYASRTEAVVDESGTRAALEATLRKRFARSSYRDLQSVSVSVEEGVIRLIGSVPSYYLKQLAQEIVLVELPGLTVVNHLVVGDGSPSVVENRPPR